MKKIIPIILAALVYAGSTPATEYSQRNDISPEQAARGELPAWESDEAPGNFETGLWPEALNIQVETYWLDHLLNDPAVPFKGDANEIRQVIAGAVDKWAAEFITPPEALRPSAWLNALLNERGPLD